jgi:hypothetical protein
LQAFAAWRVDASEIDKKPHDNSANKSCGAAIALPKRVSPPR